MTGSAPSLLLGSQTPTSCSLPVGVVSRAPGEAAVRQAAAAGLVLDEWQKLVLRESLGVRADGKWAAFASCLIVPRQNGKGAVLEALALAALFQLDVELTVWTAHQMKTAKEGFRRLVGHISRTPDLARQVAAIKRGNDDRGIELHDGRRIQFIARGTGGSGRGFTGDLLIFDEAYELDSDTMSDILPTLSAVPNPQVWYASSAPMASSEQLHSVRKRGLAGTDPRLAFFEWAAAESDIPTDEASWAKSNPGYGIRIHREAIEAEWSEMNAEVDPAKFCRERLGVPDEPASDTQVISPELWASLADPASKLVSHEAVSLAVSEFSPMSQRWASIAVAGRTSDGKLHVERLDHRPNTDWIVGRCVDIWNAKRIPFRLLMSSAEKGFADLLAERGVEVVKVTPGEYSAATELFINAATNGELVHLDQPSLNKALRGAQLRLSADGASVWSQRQSTVEITPLQAVTVAAGGVPTEKKPEFFVY